MRTAYVSVEERNVNWDYAERLCSVVGDAHARRNFLTDFRIELECQMALNVLHGGDPEGYDEHAHARRNYLLLDGGGYFGGDRKFRVALYDECKKRAIILLAISKNSPLLHDERGRDFIATTSMLSSYPLWVYPCIKKSNRDEHLYGDISVVKLCEESDRVFRCDIMEYLTNRSIEELLSPLTAISEDPRCVGYPIPLYLAHEFSAPSESMLLHYHDQVEKAMRNAGLLEVLKREELCSSFADELHGIKHAFEWEWWGE